MSETILKHVFEDEIRDIGKRLRLHQEIAPDPSDYRLCSDDALALLKITEGMEEVMRQAATMSIRFLLTRFILTQAGIDTDVAEKVKELERDPTIMKVILSAGKKAFGQKGAS